MPTFDANVLPSKLIPYRVKEIKMEPFKVPQIMKMSRAVALNSLVPAIEAINDVLDIDVNELVDGDFYYLLAWQRIVAYGHSPLKADWVCEGTVFKETGGLERTFTESEIKRIVEDYDAADDEQKAQMEDPAELQVEAQTCGHRNSVEVTMDMLSVIQYMDDLKLYEGLDFPRVSTLPDSIAFRENPEKQNVVQAARWIHSGANLAEKLDILNSQEDLKLFEKSLQTNQVNQCGVSRVISLPCEKCGTIGRLGFDIRPETFFDV